MKYCGYDNKAEDNNLKTLNDKNHQGFSWKFRQKINTSSDYIIQMQSMKNCKLNKQNEFASSLKNKKVLNFKLMEVFNSFIQTYLTYIWIYIKKKVKLATEVEDDLKAPFSIFNSYYTDL